jgi:cystathionine beta-lyase
VIVPDPERRKTMRRAGMARGIWMPNLFGVTASEAAYAEGGPWLDELLPYLSHNDAVLREELAQAAPGVQVAQLEGTFIPWIDFTALLAERGRSHEELREAIEAAGLWLSDGRLFGEEGEGFQRINIAAPREVVRDAARRIVQAVGRL